MSLLDIVILAFTTISIISATCAIVLAVRLWRDIRNGAA